jgi:predicted nucleic acid-binding protein
VWESAALAFRAYAERRRTQAGDPGPRRILADFITGAHALHRASSLLTFDQRIYRAAFPTLNVVVPTI